jgi:Tol biopolymer transport system component
MKKTFNHPNLLIILLLVSISTYSLNIFGKQDDKNNSENKKVIFSETKESIINYKNLESFPEQNVSRITFTESIDEVNVKASADSKDLLFEGWSKDGQMGIYSITALDGQNRNVIFNKYKTSTNPVFDATSKNVFFTAINEQKDTKNGILMWVDKSGIGGLHIMPTKNDGIINSIDISSKGEIAFSQNTANGSLIQLINLENNYHLALIMGDEINWSPDGSKIIFTAKDRSNIRSIFIINKNGSNLIQLTSFTEDVSSPCFSPDGNWICFAGLSKSEAINKKEASANWDIYMLSRDESKLVQLTKDIAADKSPYWAKDGSIYFTSNRFGNYEIMKISPVLK